MLSRGSVRGIASRRSSTIGERGMVRGAAAGGLGYLFASGGALVRLKLLLGYDLAKPLVQRFISTPLTKKLSALRPSPP